VSRADDRDEPRARRLTDALREVAVALVDQDRLDRRERLADLVHQLRHDVLAAELAELLLVERAVLEERIEKDRGELAFPPEGKRSPRSAERQADVAVAERDRDSEGLRRPGGLEQL